MTHVLHWFEIPAADLDRAQLFYETILARALRREHMGQASMAIFPHGQQDEGIGGCLVTYAGVPAPSADGTVVYLSAEPSLEAVVSRVEAAGGRILIPHYVLPNNLGTIAVILDSEGNRVGLHVASQP